MPIKLLVVDDSALMRRLITRLLEEDGNIKVIDTAANGEEAIKKIQTLMPDVVTMDVEMPVMDGLTALGRIMRVSPVPVIMLSAHTSTGARATMKALSLGAIDFVAKPSKPGEMDIMMADLKYKIKAAAQASLRRPAAADRKAVKKIAPAVESVTVRKSGGSISLVVIGSSTGGPAALQQVIPLLPPDFPAGVVIVQHIPAGFSGSMAEHLNRRAKIKVKHASQGDRIEPGHVLVAPAGYDLTFRGGPGAASIYLDPGKTPVSPGGFRPSVDLVMKSAAETFHSQVMGVLLTGMGKDGAQGMLAIRNESGPTLAESESTCVVFGMPKAAIEIGAAGKVLPLHEIAGEIVKSI